MKVSTEIKRWLYSEVKMDLTVNRLKLPRRTVFLGDRDLIMTWSTERGQQTKDIGNSSTQIAMSPALTLLAQGRSLLPLAISLINTKVVLACLSSILLHKK